jgi:hypothetical protein
MDAMLFPEFDKEVEPSAFLEDRQQQLMNQPYDGYGVLGAGVKDFITVYRRGTMEDWPRFWKELFTQLHSDLSVGIR